MNSPLKRAGAIVGILAILGAAIFGATLAAPAKAATGTPHLILTLKDGDVDIQLLPDIAPKHVERIVTLTGQGFYNGLTFHRVIDGFMAQTGDPTGTGMGGSQLPNVKAEFSSTHYDPGTVGAARSQDPDTFNSQFFITFADAGFLDGQYTVFGKVVAGMDVVNKIKKGDPQSGEMQDPDKIISAKIEYNKETLMADYKDPENTLLIETTKGPVVIEMRPDLAPNHVAHIKKLAREGFYDGIVFHRVIDGFMAQTGDPTGTGTGSSKYPNLKAEFNKEPHVRGVVSMARSQNPDSANSQFFIVFDDARFLDRQYTVWGKVIEGMDNVDQIKRGEPVRDPDKMVSVKVAADAK